MTAAEKRLAAATAAVEDAQARLCGAEVEANQLHVEAGTVDAAVRSAIYNATAAGSDVDVTADRDRLAGLRERMELLEPVAAALQDGVRKAEQARDRLIAEEFPELRLALVARADKVRQARAEMYQRHAAEERQVAEQVHNLEQQWRDLTRPLPAPVRPGGMTSDLDLPMTEAHSGLGIYVAEPSWPAWASAIIEESKRLQFLEGERLRMTNIPVAP